MHWFTPQIHATAGAGVWNGNSAHVSCVSSTRYYLLPLASALAESWNQGLEPGIDVGSGYPKQAA